jgi:hypothetical protein
MGREAISNDLSITDTNTDLRDEEWEVEDFIAASGGEG